SCPGTARRTESGKIARQRCRSRRVCRCCRHGVLASALITCKEKQLIPDDLPAERSAKLIALPIVAPGAARRGAGMRSGVQYAPTVVRECRTVRRDRAGERAVL